MAVLYSFVRYVDDLVDRPEPLVGDFYRAWRLLEGAWRGVVRAPVISDFVDLAFRRGFPWRWVEAFMASMEMDLYKRKYYTYRELLKYIYGSAEVVGLFMAKILGVPSAGYKYAALLGRAYQLINMIRDVAEDLRLGRQYIPQEDLDKFGAVSVAPTPEFAEVLRFELSRYFETQRAALRGLAYIPPRLRRAVWAASRLYWRTASVIYRRPLVVFEKKVRPGMAYVLGVWLAAYLR